MSRHDKKYDAHPPSWANHLLEWFCDPHLLEEVQGDLQEMYGKWVEKYGERKAKWLYVFHAFKFFRPFALKKIDFADTFNFFPMLRNYLLTALRSIFRYKILSFINILGLALGMTICLVVLMIIKDQWSYDAFHTQGERIFRITTEVTQPQGKVHYARSPLPLANTLTEQYDFIEKSVRIYPENEISYAAVSSENKELDVRGAYADSTLWDIFDFSLAIGNPDQALTHPYAVVLSKKTAIKFFGDQDPMGQMLTIGKVGDFVVTGVMENPPGKTHLQYDLLASMATLALTSQGEAQNSLEAWHRYDACFTYVLASPDVSQHLLAQSLQPVAQQALSSVHFQNQETGYAFTTQRLDEVIPIKLYMDVMVGLSSSGIYAYAGIALLVLLLAGFNYVNLSVARSLRRTKEVGIRKATGAMRGQIVWQFLTESVLLSLFALLFAWYLLQILPNFFLTKQIVDIQPDIELIGWFVVFSILVGLLAGLIPAVLFSNVTPLQALRSGFGVKLIRGLGLRKVLIVMQFAVSLVFIIILLVVYRQSEFGATADYGFDRKNLLVIELPEKKHRTMTDALHKHTKVQSVTATSGNFGLDFPLQTQCNVAKGDEPVRVWYFSVDPQFVPTMKLELLAGNNFPPQLPASEEKYVILNESALSSLGLGSPEQAIGKSVWMDDSLSLEVIGVLADFHFMRFKFPISPMALRYRPDAFRYLNIKTANRADNSIIAYLEQVGRQHTDQPLSYYAYDEKFYEVASYQQDVATVGTFSLLSIAIACLGLFGVVHYSVETRTREIGIRKVLGAEVSSITLLLSKGFVKLLLISSAIALPLGYLLSSQFLSAFVYRISIGAELLLTSVLTLLMLGLLTIASQTLRAALANSVDALRDD